MENIQPAYIKSGNTKKLQEKSLKKKNRLPACFFALAFASLLCIYPEDCAKGALRGVECCLQVLIPSLFPFMILGIFTVQTGGRSGCRKTYGKALPFFVSAAGVRCARALYEHDRRLSSRAPGALCPFWNPARSQKRKPGACSVSV